MTTLAMTVSIITGMASLYLGYSQAGFESIGRWIWMVGIVWVLAYWRKYYWFSSIALLLYVFAAGFGVWNNFSAVWMLIGAMGGLLGWDLSDFSQRLKFAAPTDDISGMERRHLWRVGMVALVGGLIAYISYSLQFKRLAFEVAVGLILVAAIGLARLVMRLRKY